jgi:hypothetical protein
MTDDGLDRLREDCPEWSDEYLAEQFSMGQAAFASSETWDIVRSEAVNRGLVSEAVARAMESETPVGDRVLDSVHDRTKDWGRLTWFFAVAIGGALAATGALLFVKYPLRVGEGTWYRPRTDLPIAGR